MIFRAVGLDDSVEVVSLGSGNHETLRVEGFTSSNYFDEGYASPVAELSLNYRAGDPDPVTGSRSGELQGGRFTLGTTMFTIAPKTVTEDTRKSGTSPLPIFGEAFMNGLEIAASLNTMSQSPPPLFKVDLASLPVRGERELIALLWFGKPLTALSAGETAEVMAIQAQQFSSVQGP